MSLGVVLVHKFSQNSYPPPLPEFCIDFSTLESLPMLSLCLGKAVGAEVKAILSPLPSALRPPVMIPRRVKGKGKSRLAGEKYGTPKGRKPASKFQRKLVVLDYMGPKPPKSFGMKESYVLMRGILPEVDVEAGGHQYKVGDDQKDLNEADF